MSEEFRIYFVKPPLNEENGSLLVKAFEELNKTEFNFKSEWVTAEDCLKTDSKGKQIYIFDGFEGKAFEHIRDLGYRTYGPLCILGNLLHGLELPKHKRRPVLNLAMKDVKVCCTSIDRPIREEITRKVSLMGGDVDSNLTADVTHLVAGEVGSNKYLVAVQNKKVVMTKEWIDAVWEASQDKHINARDAAFEKYVCPPFLGLTVCVSGFSSNERSKMRNFVMRGGGNYSGELKMNECTHLVVKEPKGAKYEAAKNWKIRIVNDRWLYESMDKHKYIDPRPYQFNTAAQEKNVKTSTPERRSVLGPHIADISAISCGANTSLAPVDETRDMTTTKMFEQLDVGGKNCVAESKMGTTALDIDTTRSSVDIMLDGCKIYLSGLKPVVEEKMRKIISVSGALKSSTIDSSVTHVVIGDVIPSDVQLLSKLKKCPYVVSVDWMMDSFSKNVHLSEAKYERTDLGLVTPSMRKSDNKSEDVSTSKSAPKEGNADKSSDKSTDSQAFRMEAPSDMEMAELLSQYSAPQAQSNQAQNVSGGQTSQNETLKANRAAEEDNMTQDPDDITHQEGPECDGIFSGKAFTVLGFDEDETAQLETFIADRGGQISGSSSSKNDGPADIAIVPLMGYPVDGPVSEILTNAWLQMCIEVDQFLPYEDCWLSRPVELPEEELLINCCISVSGYVGVERECITHLCQSLGATCQDHFARRSNKNVEASTHLIVNFPTGTKYDAAKKWGIPAVGKEWIFSCITSGNRVAEADYDIDLLEQRRLAKLQQKDEEDAAAAAAAASTSLQSLPTPTRRTDEPEKCLDNASNNGETVGREQGSFHEANTTPCTNVDSKESTRGSVKEVVDRVPTSSAESSGSGPKPAGELNPMAEACRQFKSATPKTRLSMSSNSACRPNQSENITAGKLRTPVDVARQKWGSADQSPASECSTPIGLVKGGGETPGTFMQPGYRPKFNRDELDTSGDSVNLNKSTPLGEVFRRHVSKAAQNIEAKYLAAQDRDVEEMPASQSQPEELPPLHDVVIAVAKKLGRSHETYNRIVVELGGDYSWRSGPHVTHFVFQGRPNDTNKEFRKAREEGKIIVSPHWLIVCQEQNCRVDESLFPHNYNPSCSLTLTPARRGTPRNTRAMVKSTSVHSEAANPAVSTPATKTPRKMPVLNLQSHVEVETPEGRTEPARGPDHATSPPEVTAARVPSEAAVGRVSIEPPNVSVETPTGQNTGAASNPHSNKTAELSSADRSKNQEMKEALSKTLGTVLAEASRTKRSARRKGKLVNLSGQMNTPDNSLGEGNASNSGSTVWTNKNKETKQAPAPEPSQSLQVTWDDPTERLEKEKLAHRLETVCQSSHSTDEMLAGVDVPCNISPDHERTKVGAGAKFTERSPTPEPPPLAFPIAQPSSHVRSPQPVELLSEESSDSRPCYKPPPVFLISGMTNEERMDYSALVEQLGGRMVEIQHFDPSATHLVVGQPARNEKYLSCIASGKWVLHKSFFEACRKEGKFVKEDQHEWGGDYTLPLVQNMTAQAKNLAAAANKWRRKVAALREANPSCQGAFDGWKVLLCMAKNKEDNFHRLLQAGGATVSTLRSPFPVDVEGTHAFLDLNKVPVTQEDLENLIHAGIHCLKAEYIPAFLTEDPPPDPSDFYPAEVIPLKASMPETNHNRKRQNSHGDSTSGIKRARKH